jgi:hypothetical protein
LEKNVKIITALTLCVLALVPRLSSAEVIYEWKNVGDAPGNIFLQMKFDDAAVQSGRLDLSARGSSGPTTPIDTGLISLVFFGSGGGAHFLRTGLDFTQSSIELHVSFDPSGFMSGSFYLNDGFTELVAGSASPRFWEVTGLRSDNPSITWCGFNTSACDLGRGMMRRTDMPEPGSFALLGIGLSAAAGIRRRTRR